MPRLENGQTFPHLSLPAVGGGRIDLPLDLAGSYGVVLFYRGAWCPYCNAQLAAFSRADDALVDADIRVVAGSVDGEEEGSALVAKHHLTFPVGHSLDAGQVADAVGAYVNPDRGFLESTGFVIAPDGMIITAVYSSNAIGRLVPDDVIGLVRYHAAHHG